MPFIPHTRADTDAMLRAIGVDDLEDLFAEIPAELKCGGLKGIPEALSERPRGGSCTAAPGRTNWR